MKNAIINKFISKFMKLLFTLFICLAANWSNAQNPIFKVPSGQKIKMPKIDNTYYGTNNVMQLYIGERVCNPGQWMFDYNGYWTSGLYFEQYAVWYNNQIHYAMNGFPILDYFGTSTNDADKKCVTKTGNIEIERSVYIPPGDAHFFKISYVLKNTGTETVTDVRFFEVVDFDILGYTSNFGWYDSNTDFVWIKSDDTYKNGFVGSKPSTRHCAVYWNHAIFSDASDGNLTNDNEYSGDAGIGLQWNIGDLGPGKTWDVDITFWFGQPNYLTAEAGPNQIVFAGKKVSFDATGSTAERSEIVAYNWDMDGDGEYDDAHGLQPTYIFQQHGTQDVLLQVVDDQGVEAYDICTITILPSFTSIIVKDYLPINGITLDTNSILPPPHSVTTANDKKLIEWHIDGMGIDSSLNLSYDVEILNPVAGESRMVESSTDLSYTDKSDSFQHFELGPSFIDVISEHNISVKTDKEKYFANEKANVSVDLSLGSNSIKTFSSQQEFKSGKLSQASAEFNTDQLSLGIENTTSLGNVIVNGDFETGNSTSWTTSDSIWMDSYSPISGSYSLGMYSDYMMGGSAYIYQEITLPANTAKATLSCSDRSGWHYGDYKIEIRDTLNNVLKTLYTTDRSNWNKESRSFDISEFANKTVRIYFSNGTEGELYIDDVKLDIKTQKFFKEGSATYVIDAGQTVVWDKLSFRAQIPEGASLSFKVREADTAENLKNALWGNSITQNNKDLTVQVARFLEVKVNMTTENVALTPSLDMFKVSYIKLPVNALKFKVYIKDSQGNQVEELSSVIPSIELGKLQHYEYIFNTQNNLAGNYFAHADLYNNDVLIASGTDGFEIVSQSAEIAIDGNVKTDKLEYIEGETARIKSTVFNSSSNVNTSGLTVTVNINDSSGNAIKTYNYTIANLLQKSTDQKELLFAVGASLPGTYTVKQTVTSGAETLSSKQTAFKVVTSVEQGKGIAGTVVATPLTVKRKSGSVELNISAKNTGNVDLNNVELKTCVYDPITYQILKTFTSTASLSKSGTAYTNMFNYSAIDLLPKSYPITLTANLVYNGQNISIPLDVNGMTVTNDAPVANAGLDQTIEGTSSAGATVNFDGSGSSDANSINPPAMNDDIVSYEWKENATILSTEMIFGKTLKWGSHTITLTVKDSLGLSSTDTVVINITDTVAPVISDLTPANEIIGNTAFPTFAAKVSDACSGVDYGTAQLTVDNNPLTVTNNSATGLVSAVQENSLTDGWHNVVLKISDKAGNQAISSNWKIGVDTIGPVISGMTPANNTIIPDNTPDISVKVADTFSGIKADSILLSIDGQNQTAAYDANTGIVTVAASTLTDGWHNIKLQVSDNAGNQSSTGEWKIGIDTTKPTISSMTPASGSVIYDKRPEISAVVADNFSGINPATIEFSLNGTVITHNYDAAAGKVTAVVGEDMESGEYNIVLKVSDKAGNENTSTTWQMTILNYLIFHNSTKGQLDISGSNKIINGRIHSNANLKIVGTNNDVMDVASAVGNIKVNGSKHDISQQNAGAPSQLMPEYNIEYYKQKANFTHEGNLTIGNGDTLEPGIHFVKGNVRINKGVDANVTIVATGSIKLASGNIKITSADSKNHIVLYSATNIDLSCNNAYLKGIIYAPNGECKQTSNDNTIVGAIIANTVDISGAKLNISPWTN